MKKYIVKIYFIDDVYDYLTIIVYLLLSIFEIEFSPGYFFDFAGKILVFFSFGNPRSHCQQRFVSRPCSLIPLLRVVLPYPGLFTFHFAEIENENYNSSML